jgi:hypothetical protein
MISELVTQFWFKDIGSYYPKMAMLIENTMINHQIVGYPIFRTTRILVSATTNGDGSTIEPWNLGVNWVCETKNNFAATGYSTKKLMFGFVKKWRIPKEDHLHGKMNWDNDFRHCGTLGALFSNKPKCSGWTSCVWMKVDRICGHEISYINLYCHYHNKIM